jgi:hypothetical protein
LRAGFDAGSECGLENPVDAGDEDHPEHLVDRKHAPLWLMPEVIAFKKHAGCREVTFPQCAFGSMFRKMTIFFLTPALGHILGGVNNLRCTHTHHEQRADGTPRYAKMRVLEGALPGTQHAKQQRSTVTNEGRKKSRIQKNSKKRPPKSGQQDKQN